MEASSWASTDDRKVAALETKNQTRLLGSLGIPWEARRVVAQKETRVPAASFLKSRAPTVIQKGQQLTNTL